MSAFKIRRAALSIGDDVFPHLIDVPAIHLSSRQQ